MGPWEQRPVFKSHVTEMTTLRSCEPIISFPLLRKITNYFPSEDFEFKLDPSFEPTEEPRNLYNEGKFRDLQKYASAGLVVPVDEDHMYYAALHNKSCVLTYLGKMYWNMAKSGRI